MQPMRTEAKTAARTRRPAAARPAVTSAAIPAAPQAQTTWGGRQRSAANELLNLLKDARGLPRMPS